MFENKMLWLFIGILACAVALSWSTAAGALEVERIQGTIVMASEGQVAFKDVAGTQRILTTTPDCMVTINGQAMRLDDLQTGMAAMLLVNRNGQCMHIDARSTPAVVGYLR
jgi:hypothetical protein